MSAYRLRALLTAGAATVLVVACSHGSSNMAGHWRGVKAEGVTSDLLPNATGYAGHMKLDVKGDAITVTTASDTRTDHYVVILEDKTKTVIATDSDGDAGQQVFTFSDPSTMKWAVTPSAAVVFVKE
jgi:hypothetical protein